MRRLCEVPHVFGIHFRRVKRELVIDVEKLIDLFGKLARGQIKTAIARYTSPCAGDCIQLALLAIAQLY